MPPKPNPRRPAKPRYAHPREYYKAAYRAHMIANTDWNAAQRNGTLAWMWIHASDEEKQLSQDLFSNNSQALPDVDTATVPDEWKDKNDPAPTVADEEEGEDEDEGGVPAANSAAPAGAPAGAEAGPSAATARKNDSEPPAKKQRLNTTAFSFWPDPSTTDYSFVFPEVSNIGLPEEEEDDDDDDDEPGKDPTKFLKAGFLHPEKEENRWHGVHMLGQGANARVGLWVRANDQNTIEECMAARDVMIQPGVWVNPTSWRDQLPREIAVQRRLHARNGHDHHVHRYYADRISMHQRVYRIFNELCNLDNLKHALYYYLGQWYPRHVTFRWLEAHPDILDAVNDNRLEDAQKLHSEAWARFTSDPEHAGSAAEPDAEQAAILKELRRIQFIDKYAQVNLPDEPKEVIPERFIWTVFDQLVDAFTILATGGEVPENDDIKWKDIVHNDVHIMNIFVKKADGADGIPLPDYEGYVQFDSHEYPSVALSDFDRAFFDLQDEDDMYADNPTHYMWGPTPLINPFIGGRYPPEVYWNYTGHTGEAFHKLDSRTNVWGIGLIIWTLVMNLPSRHVVLEMPFLDHEGNKGRNLIDGTPYTAADLENLLSGNTPYEASRRYSDDLKAIARRCLAYEPEDRPTLQELRDITRKHLEAKKTTRSGKARSKPEEVVIIQVPEAVQKYGIGADLDVPAPAGGTKGKGKGKRKRNNH